MISCKKLLGALVYLSIFSSIFFVNITVGSYSVLHLFILLTLLLFIVFYKNPFVKSIFRFDKIGLSFFCLGLAVVLSYIFNLNNFYYIEFVYQNNSDNSPPFLFFKILVNGILNLMISFVAMRTGKILIYDQKSAIALVKFIIFLVFLNSLINLIAWVLQTGGKIGRYNFEPPISVSPGISIQLATLGFLLILPFFKKYSNRKPRLILWIVAFVLTTNIIIIMTRQNQLMFFAMVVVYFLLSNKLSILKLLVFSIVILLSIAFFAFIIINSENADMYSDLNSTDSTDIIIRFTMINSAWKLFLSNPMFGVGYGMFVGHNLDPIFITGHETYLASVHNGLMAILAELGIIGLFFYLNMNLIVLKNLNIIRKEISSDFFRRIVTSIYSVQLILSITFLFSNSHLLGPPSEVAYLCYSYLSWLLIGITIGISDLNLKSKNENSSYFIGAVST